MIRSNHIKIYFHFVQELAEAIDLATEAIELHPDTYEGYYARSKAYLEMENLVNALGDVRAALENSGRASIDIKDILIRLEREIQQRIQITSNDGAADTIETITDL